MSALININLHLRSDLLVYCLWWGVNLYSLN